MLLTALCLPEDISDRYVLALKVQCFSKVYCHHDLKAFRQTDHIGVL